ncbi:hypothetical protein [Paludibacterium paludis]|uniref:Uncharacterized protein n=1 Tax=Paludibacterium paludis TaxID=1225769 RepID=A0A918P644_9NEIS|nr:hypothetical protein [Paludibacterium paludis]GGY24582.1 hypothetical protein GCM10011289_30250 [Paludibacterium paludis]
MSCNRTVLIERYPDSFDRRQWGGIETAYWNLARVLPSCGVEAVWYTARECPTLASLARRAQEVRAAAVMPLVDHELFRTPQAAPAGLRRRTVRVWHDVSAISPRFSTLTGCDAHRPGSAAVCRAEAAAPSASAADVFFYEEAWTHCFPNRRYIPWAADHVPARDYHNPSGPLVLLAGKIPLDTLRPVVEACLARGLRLRVIFNNWSKLGLEAKTYFTALGLGEGHRVFDIYDIERDHERIFGGACAVLVLSHFHETFNFLAAEAVQLGVPVVAFVRSGATRRFASHLEEDGDGLIDWLDDGGLAALRPLPRSGWSWRDVGSAYAELLGCLEAEPAW